MTLSLACDEPDLQRDFKIPGGTFVAVLAIIPPAVVSCAQLYFAAGTPRARACVYVCVCASADPIVAVVVLAAVGIGEGGSLVLDGVNVWHPDILSMIIVISLGVVGAYFHMPFRSLHAVVAAKLKAPHATFASLPSLSLLLLSLSLLRVSTNSLVCGRARSRCGVFGLWWREKAGGR